MRALKNLTRADLVRLRRSAPLRGLALLTLLSGLFLLGSWYATNRAFLHSGDLELYLPLDFFLFHHAPYLSYLAAAFSCLVLGTEFLSGAIRTKAALGHSRHSIYLSLLLQITLGVLVLSLLHPLALLVAGMPLYGPLQAEPAVFLAALAGMVFLSLVLAALFTALYLGSRLSPSAATVACALLALGMHWSTTQLKIQLEVYQVQGLRRILFSALQDILPSGQAAQLSAMDVRHLPAMVLWSILLVVLTTALGISGSQKRDLN